MLDEYAPGIARKYRKSSRDLVEAVGGLPLALVLVGKQLKQALIGYQSARVKKALDDTLVSGLPQLLEAVISWCDRALSEDEQKALRALSIFRAKPNSFSESAALAAASSDIGILYGILSKGLIEAAGEKRYTLHQAVQEYARVRLENIKEGAAKRLVEFFVSFLEDNRDGLMLIGQETVNINTALYFASLDVSFDRLFVRGANAYSKFLRARGMNKIAATTLLNAYELAKRTGGSVPMAQTSINLARHFEKLGEYRKADELLEECKALLTTDDVVRTARMLHVRGVISYNLCRYEDARKFIQRGVVLLSRYLQMSSDMPWRDACIIDQEAARALCDLLERRCVVALARAAFREAWWAAALGLLLARRIKDRVRQAEHLLNAAWVQVEMGNSRRARALAKLGYERARKLRHPEFQAALAHRLGKAVPPSLGLEIAQGIVEVAEKAEQQFSLGLKIARRIGHLWYECLLSYEIGWTKFIKGLNSDAQSAFEDAYRIALRIESSELGRAATIGLAAVRYRAMKIRQLEQEIIARRFSGGG